jgi:hypothetical protein
MPRITDIWTKNLPLWKLAIYHLNLFKMSGKTSASSRAKGTQKLYAYYYSDEQNIIITVNQKIFVGIQLNL